MKPTIKIRHGIEWLGKDDSQYQDLGTTEVTVQQLGELMEEHPEFVAAFGGIPEYRTKPDFSIVPDRGYWATGRDTIELARGQSRRAGQLWRAALNRWSFAR